MRQPQRILLLALLVWGWTTAAGPAVLIDKVVAVVNDDVITLSELQKEGKPLIQRIREASPGDAQANQMQITERQILDAMILRRLQLQEAKKEKIVVDESDVVAAIERIKQRNGFASDAELKEALAKENLTPEEFRTKIWEQMVVERLLHRKVRTSVVVSEEEIAQYYRAHDQYRQAPSVRIRHILIRLPENPTPEDEARARRRGAEALEELKKGTGFAQVAAQYSDGAAALEGGDLGVIRKGELDAALEAAAFSLEPGKVSDIIQTAAGLNIIKVEERMGGQAPVGKVWEEIQERLVAQKLEQRMTEYFEELKKKAYIDVRLGQ